MASKTLQKSQGTVAGKRPAKHWREGDSRDERGRLIKEALFKAAAEIVGDVGYELASVAMITQRAGVAHGTFYNHFASRQDIFDQLLPALGKEMLEHVRVSAHDGVDLLEKETLGFTAFFSFLKSHPHFFRILNEAESFAPKAYRTHLDIVATSYMEFFERAHERGELPGFDKKDFEVIAYMLMAARSYLAWRYVYGAENRMDIPAWVVEAYTKFVREGLSRGSDTPTKKSRRKREAAAAPVVVSRPASRPRRQS